MYTDSMTYCFIELHYYIYYVDKYPENSFQRALHTFQIFKEW